MLELLAGCACGLIVVFSFLLGKWSATKPMLPIEPDRMKQIRYEEDQKAFSDVMNYSSEIAYSAEN